jgi:hypothetical protein
MPANEGFDCVAQLVFALEAGSIESLPLQQTEYNFNPVQPACRGWCEMKLYSAFVLREAVAVFLVWRVIVQDRVDLFFCRLFPPGSFENLPAFWIP